MPTYVVPETVEHALELLECGLLYRNNCFRVPRTEKWELCECADEIRKNSIHDAYACSPSTSALCMTWHRTDFAYVLEE